MGITSVWAYSFGFDSMWYWFIYSCISYSPSFSSSTRFNARLSPYTVLPVPSLLAALLTTSFTSKKRKKARRSLDIVLTKVPRSNARITFLRIREGKEDPLPRPFLRKILPRGWWSWRTVGRLASTREWFQSPVPTVSCSPCWGEWYSWFVGLIMIASI